MVYCSDHRNNLTTNLSAERFRESVVYILVLNSVTSTPQWIHQPEPRDMHDVCVIVCKCAYIVLYNSKAFHSPDLFATLS